MYHHFYFFGMNIDPTAAKSIAYALGCTIGFVILFSGATTSVKRFSSSSTTTTSTSSRTKVLFRRFAGPFARWKLKLIFRRHENAECNNDIKVQAIFIYPVKSLSAVSLSNSQFDAYGLRYDRRFMLVRPAPMPLKGFFAPHDITHRFVTQRQVPSLAKIGVELLLHSNSKDPYGLLYEYAVALSYKDQRIIVNAPSTGQKYQVAIWEDTVNVIDCGDEVAQFIKNVMVHESLEQSDSSNYDLRLVAMDPRLYERRVNEKYTPLAAFDNKGYPPSVGFTDGFPILIATENSLEELNSRIAAKGKQPIPMNRFRPNIVLRGNTATKPFIEDEWKMVKIDKTIFYIVKSCPRCRQSCTDQATGEVSDEPLNTLADFRVGKQSQPDVFFAQNAIYQLSSEHDRITVGDTVQILEKGQPVFE